MKFLLLSRAFHTRGPTLLKDLFGNISMSPIRVYHMPLSSIMLMYSTINNKYSLITGGGGCMSLAYLYATSVFQSYSE